MKRHFHIIMILFVITGLSVSCVKKNESRDDEVVENPANGGNNGNNGGNPPPPSGQNCVSAGTQENSNQLNDYYRFQVIGDGNFGSVPGWTSAQLANPNLLVTDSRLKVRVIARPAPAPQSGPNCQYQDEYLRLRFKVGAKVSGAAGPPYEQIMTVADLHIDSGTDTVCSPIFEYNLGQFTPTNSPYQLEVYDVDWDRCPTAGGSVGYEPPSEDPACAYNDVFDNNCFELELQVVTDYTWDFNPYPAP